MTDTHDHDNDGWGETIYVHSDGAPHATPDSPLPGGPPVPNQTLIEEALTLPCPHCGAQPGEQCHSGWIDNLPLPAGARRSTARGPRNQSLECIWTCQN